MLDLAVLLLNVLYLVVLIIVYIAIFFALVIIAGIAVDKVFWFYEDKQYRREVLKAKLKNAKHKV